MPFHITPLFKQFILPEYLLIKRAKRMGVRIILDLRAGNKANDRARFGPIYRYLFDCCVRVVDVVSVEGEEYLALANSIAPTTPAYYLPNFVGSANISDELPVRSNNICRLVYVGTVSEAKGVPELLLVADKLVEIGLMVQVDITGRPIASYHETFVAGCKGRPYVTAHGAQNFDTVRNLLDQCHFFVFLTKWRGEGHSNALTESMARGCIPIATRHGFNQSTVSNSALTFENRREIDKIASAIKNLWLGPNYDKFAKASIERVRDQYSEHKIKKVLMEMYWGNIQL